MSEYALAVAKPTLAVSCISSITVLPSSVLANTFNIILADACLEVIYLTVVLSTEMLDCSLYSDRVWLHTLYGTIINNVQSMLVHLDLFLCLLFILSVVF